MFSSDAELSCITRTHCNLDARHAKNSFLSFTAVLLDMAAWRLSWTGHASGGFELAAIIVNIADEIEQTTR